MTQGEEKKKTTTVTSGKQKSIKEHKNTEGGENGTLTSSTSVLKVNPEPTKTNLQPEDGDLPALLFSLIIQR